MIKIKKQLLLTGLVWFAVVAEAQAACSCALSTGNCNPTAECSDNAKASCEAGGGVYYSTSDCSAANKEESADSGANADMGEVTGNDAVFNYNYSLLLKQGGESVATRYHQTFDIVNLVVRYLYIAAGLVFFALILTSGYRLVFMGDKQKAWSSVKSNLTTGVIGLLIMFAVYWLIAIMEKLTGLAII